MKRLKKRDRVITRKKNIRIFYISLSLFIFSTIAMIAGIVLKYKIDSNWSSLWLVFTTIIIWSIILILQAWKAFGGGFLFKENWEEKKMKEYLKDEEHTLWE